MRNRLADAAAGHEASQSIDIDQSLKAIQLGRRLQKITSSIENFFHSQIDRLENTLAICQRDVDQSDAVRQMLASFAQQKQCWETEREAEIARLDRACSQLIDGWKQLEDARRRWLAEQSTRKSEQTEPASLLAENITRLPIESFPLDEEKNQTRSRELNDAELESLRLAMHQHRNACSTKQRSHH